MAARSDPWTLDRQLRDRIAEHQRVLAARPADRQDALQAAIKELQTAQVLTANLEANSSHSRGALDALGPLTGLSRHGRDQRRMLQNKLAADTERASAAHAECDQVAGRVAQLRRDQETFERFEATNGWQRDDIVRLQIQLDHHWAGVIAACVRADDPLGFGIDKLRHARTTVVTDLRSLDASIPVDRSKEWEQERRQMPSVVRDRHDAEQAFTDSRALLEEAGRRRWGRIDHEAIDAAHRAVAVAEQRAQRAAEAERDLRERLAALAQHQQQRRTAVADVAPRRKALEISLGQLDAALGHTLPDRVRTLAGEPPPYLVKRLGPAPSSPAGRAVWCHHALNVEAVLDRNDGQKPSWTGWSRQVDRARREIAIADRLLETGTGQADPTGWAMLAEQAGSLVEEANRTVRIQTAIDRLTPPTREFHHSPGVDHAAQPQGPELSL